MAPKTLRTLRKSTMTTAKHDREQVRALAKLETKMDLLTERVDKHNQVVEKTYRMETDITNLYHRYDEVKEALK